VGNYPQTVYNGKLPTKGGRMYFPQNLSGG